MEQKLVEESRRSKVIIGHAGLATRNGHPVHVPGAVHDGDTVSTHALANIAVRFLGVDTPEITLPLPGKTAFLSINNPEWEAFLSDPFAGWPDATTALGRKLRTELEGRAGPGAATNHHDHAKNARAKLRELVAEDVVAFAGGDESKYRFFLRYARDVIDRYGRLLAYINVNVTDPSTAPAKTYNERMLELGLASPYFIWPNLDPFKKQPNLFDAVPAPEKMTAIANGGRLGDARRSVHDARSGKLGIFGPDPLRLQPFELRFLSQRRAPERWVIDMSTDDGVMLRPADYYRIERLEDRLFIPAEYASLFEMKGWIRREG